MKPSECKTGADIVAMILARADIDEGFAQLTETAEKYRTKPVSGNSGAWHHGRRAQPPAWRIVLYVQRKDPTMSTQQGQAFEGQGTTLQEALRDAFTRANVPWS